MADPLRTWPALDLRTDRPVSHADEDHVALALDGLGVAAVEHDGGRGWRVYFATARERAMAAAALPAVLGGAFRVTSLDVPDEGWAAKVQSVLRAVEIGGLVVCPPWDLPGAVPPATRVIVIEPSTGFGTGHHQSTRLCLQALQRLDLPGRRVIDVGTGSGVLAIASRLLGAAEVLAIDTDADAVASARDNADRNGVGGEIAFLVEDLASIDVAAADVVLANLTAVLLRRLATPLAGLVAPGGILVTSGFNSDQVTLVTESFPGFALARRDDEDDWVGLTFERPR